MMIGVTSEAGPGVARVRIVGPLSLGELSGLIEQYHDLPAGTPACLVDLTSASAAGLRFHDVRALAQLSLARGLPRPGTRIGLVADDPVTYGVCRMLQGLRGDLTDGLGVFTSEAEAAAWVGSAGGLAQA
jgi:hypothetical protein